MCSVAEGICLNIITVLEAILMMCGIFCVPINRNKREVLCGAVLFCGWCLGDFWFGRNSFMMLSLRLFIIPIIILLWSRGAVIRRVAVYICSVMYLHMPYLCISLVCSGILEKPMSVLKGDINYRIFRGFLTCAILVLMFCRLRKIPRYCEIVGNLQVKYFLMGSVCSLAASVVQHYIEDVSEIVYGKADQIIFITGCMVIVSGMFYALGAGVVVLDLLRQKYQAESRLKDAYLEITREYVHVVRDNAKETRKVRHDLQAHISSLKYYMEHREYQKAEQYLAALQEHTMQAVRGVVTVNHEIVDAMLLEAQFKGEPYQIAWEIEGILPTELPIGDFDLCTIFSNLLSNSIEACARVPVGRRYVHLEIRQWENHLVIELSNPIRGSIVVEHLGNVTSKRDARNHGYGIANVRAAVERNHGELFFEIEEGIFTARILFQL